MKEAEYTKLPEDQNGDPGTYKGCSLGSLFFNYMGEKMRLANEREKAGSSLKGNSSLISRLDVDIYKISKERSAEKIYEKFWARYQTTKSIFGSLYTVMRDLVPTQVCLLLIYQITQVPFLV